jgi:hypothetical protein
MLCLGYIIGVMDSIGYQQFTVLSPDRRPAWQFSFICMPNGAETSQTRDVVVKYLEDHPENRTKDAAVLIFSAMLAVWRCPEK